jgi:hypothetical protein
MGRDGRRMRKCQVGRQRETGRSADRGCPVNSARERRWRAVFTCGGCRVGVGVDVDVDWTGDRAGGRSGGRNEAVLLATRGGVSVWCVVQSVCIDRSLAWTRDKNEQLCMRADGRAGRKTGRQLDESRGLGAGEEDFRAARVDGLIANSLCVDHWFSRPARARDGILSLMVNSYDDDGEAQIAIPFSGQSSCCDVRGWVHPFD